MYDVKDDAKAGYRRVEVLTGPGRRRRWSVEEKDRIVAEASAPGAAVSEVTRRWQVCAQQVFGWRREAQRNMAQSAAFDAPAFVPILSEDAPMMGKLQPGPGHDRGQARGRRGARGAWHGWRAAHVGAAGGARIGV